MNAYADMKGKHQKEVDEFPMFFAFSEKQFDEGMKKLGLEPDDIKAIYKLGNTGGFIHRSNAEKMDNMWSRHEKEMQKAIQDDATGDGFIFDMFNYELGNHEYVVTGDISDALNALGLTVEEINNNAKLLHGLKKAIKAQIDWYEKNN